jgi:hypothetical protein
MDKRKSEYSARMMREKLTLWGERERERERERR